MRKKVQFRNPVLFKFLYLVTNLMYWLYYRRITVVGSEKIPKDTPVIFAPNHQNALMDALAVPFTAHRIVVFLARADIFKKPAIAKLLNLLRILPIYRIRDGIDSLGRNQEVFENTVSVLKSNTPICILPEGNHEGNKRLRPLKKGIFRIAFQAEESASYKLNLHIVPVGLDYSDYFNPGSELLVVYGKPIRIADYAGKFRENEQRTIHSLMDLLTESMKEVMIHIPEQNYELIYQISEMYEPNVWDTYNLKRHAYNKLTIKQYIIQKLTEAFTHDPEKAPALKDALSAYIKTLSKLNLKDCHLQQSPSRFIQLLPEMLLSVLLIPFQVYGSILNFIPYQIPTLVASKMKDKHFKSSVQFGISIFSFPLYYLIMLIVFWMLTDDNMLTLIFGLTLPVSGYFAFYNFKRLKKLVDQVRLLYFRLTGSKQFIELQNERIQLFDLIKSTINS